MHTQIKKAGLANGVKATGRKYTLSDMIQESFRVSYKAKAKGDETLISLTEAHLARVKKNPTDPHLNGDLEVLTKLANRKAPLNEVKAEVTKKTSGNPWNSKALREGLSNFRSSAKSKIFLKEFEKLRKPMTTGKLTLQESINLYKAVNSCMTHLTVELEKNPNFRKTYTECTAKLATDNAKLLEAIQKGVSPDKALLKNYLSFNKLLHEGAIVDNDDESDEDIIGYKEPEEEPVDECGDPCVGEDCPPEEAPDAINEDASEEDPSVDLTPEEIKVLKSILGKISNLEVPEDDDALALEEPVNPVIPDEGDEVNEDEDLTPANEVNEDEDITEDEPVEDDEDEVSEDLDIPLDGEDGDLKEEDEVEEPVDAEDTVEEDEVEDSEDDLPKRLEKLSDELNEVAKELQGNSDEEEEVTYEEDPELAECDECSDVNPDNDSEEDLEECDAPSLEDEEPELNECGTPAIDEDPDLEECDAPIIDDEDDDDLITEAIKHRIKRCF